MAALNNSVPGPCSLYPSSIPELTSYLGYSNLIGPHGTPAATLNGTNHGTGMTTTNGLGAVYAAAAAANSNNPAMIGANSLFNPAAVNQFSAETMGLVGSRPGSGAQWVIPNHFMKSGQNDSVTPSALLPNAQCVAAPNGSAQGLDRNCKHVQLYI